MSFTESVEAIVEQDTSGLLATHQSWARVQLREVATVLNGYPFSSGQFNRTEGVPLVRIRDVLRGESGTFYSGSFDDAYFVHPGDLVVGMDGDFNSALWRGPAALLNQRVCKIAPDERHYDRRLLAYVVPGYLRAINARTSSITVKHLSSRTIEQLPLPLPPLPEQQRIVAEIEKQFTRLDAAVAGLERVRANLRRYRAAVLDAACSGRLVPTEAELASAEGREYESGEALLDEITCQQVRTKNDDKGAQSPAPLAEVPAGWASCVLGQLIAQGPQNGLYRPASEYGEGIPILRIDDYQDDRQPLRANLRQLRASERDVEAYGLQARDLVINRVNSPSHLGKCLVVAAALLPSVFESNMMRMRLSSFIDADWIAMYLRSRSGRARLTANAKWAVNQASINQRDVWSTPALVPPRSEQHRIVAEVERRLSLVEKLETVVDDAQKRAGALRQSILKRAFEGKLVPQDPDDEPANVLLKRIRAERAAISSNATAPKRVGRKKVRA